MSKQEYLQDLENQFNKSMKIHIGNIEDAEDKKTSDTVTEVLTYDLKYTMKERLVLAERINICKHIIKENMSEEEAKTYISNQMLSLSETMFENPYPFEYLYNYTRMFALKSNLRSLYSFFQ